MKKIIGSFVAFIILLICCLPAHSKWQNSIVKKRQENLNVVQKSSVYGFSIIMTLGGLAHGYYEVSKEQFYMFIPNKNKVHFFKSDFALKAQEIRKEVEGFKKIIKKSKKDSFKYECKEVKLTYGKTPYRVILALNPPTLCMSAKLDKSKNVWNIKYEVKVPVKYSEHYVNYIPTLFGKIKINQKMFWHLQNAGWLYPYDAVWQWDEEVRP